MIPFCLRFGAVASCEMTVFGVGVLAAKRSVPDARVDINNDTLSQLMEVIAATGA